LNGDIKSLLGVVYNGSFDTPYERSAIAIATLQIESLSTAVWLNYSSAIPNYSEMRYLSYPRSPLTQNIEIFHMYLSHEIHSAPDFDQVVHITVDLSKCVCKSSSQNCKNWLGDVQVPGAEWTFPTLQNNITSKLMPGDNATAIFSRNSQVVCPMVVLEQIHCVVGPGFADNC
jgi:hypothetical protein